MKSKNKEQRKDYVGLNRETSWILISDHFSCMLIGNTRISKGTPLVWLEKFLQAYLPKCNNKYVMMDQGGELHRNLKVHKLFKEHRCAVQPTGAGALNQNGPVKCIHQTITDHV